MYAMISGKCGAPFIFSYFITKLHLFWQHLVCLNISDSVTVLSMYLFGYPKYFTLKYIKEQYIKERKEERRRRRNETIIIAFVAVIYLQLETNL